MIDESAFERHRDYGLLLQRHQRAQRRKKTRQIFIYALLVAVVTVLALIIISYFMVKWEKERELKRHIKSSHANSIPLQKKLEK